MPRPSCVVFTRCPASPSWCARRRRAGHHARLQRQQQGRRNFHQQLGAVSRRDRAGRIVRRLRATPRHHAATVPRPRRHGRARRRAELPGDPRAAARHGERADPPDRAGRGDRARSTRTPKSAARNLETLVAATLEATLLNPTKTAPRGVSRCRARRSATASIDAYRQLVYETPGFTDYFFSATPIREIAELNIGSRPASRKATQRDRGPARDSVELQLGPVPRGAAGLVRFRLGDRSVPRQAKPKQREERLALLQQMHRQWPFFRTLLSNLDMVMAKSDLGDRRALCRPGRGQGARQADLRPRSRPNGSAPSDALSLITGEKPARLEPVARALDRAPLSVPRSAQPPAGRADAPLPAAQGGDPENARSRPASTSRSTASRPVCATRGSDRDRDRDCGFRELAPRRPRR